MRRILGSLWMKRKMRYLLSNLSAGVSSTRWASSSEKGKKKINKCRDQAIIRNSITVKMY
jgi:hypothetical protein